MTTKDESNQPDVSEGEPRNDERDNEGGRGQTPRRERNEGADESLRSGQVRKRSSDLSNTGREVPRPSFPHDVSGRSRYQDSLREPNADRFYTRRSSVNQSYKRHRVSRRERSSSRTLYRDVSADESPERGRRTAHRERNSNRILYSDASEGESPKRCRRRRRSSSDSDHCEHRPTRNRRRSRSPLVRERSRSHYRRERSRSPPLRERSRDNRNFNLSSDSTNILHKFLDILTNVKGQSTSKLSSTNVLPEFDPLAKDQTIVTWLTKVEECAEIYSWGEREIIHFALPKLTGLAKTWYQGLNSVLYSWTEWKRKLIESFPCRDDYAELLTEMLAKRVRYGESLEQYYYSKVNLLNRCSISGRKAVDCILHGIDDRAIKVGAQAARFKQPEDVLKYLKTVKVGNAIDRQKFRVPGTSVINKNKTDFATKIKCHNCDEEGHKSFKCTKPPNKCSSCNRVGHLDVYCRSKQAKNTNALEIEVRSENIKSEKQVSVLNNNNSEGSNKKYLIEIKVGNNPLLCYVDLGSQCTLIRECEAKLLKLEYSDTDCLPILRGLGGNAVRPLGRCNVNIFVQGIEENVEVFVVGDGVLKYAMLLGHSFTERPDIIITKTPEQIIFERSKNNKLFLMTRGDVLINPKQVTAVSVETPKKYNGPLYINGSIRGTPGFEYYLLPGEYVMNDGICSVLVHNMCDRDVIFQKGTLITRALPISISYETLLVSFDDQNVTDAINYGEHVTPEQKLHVIQLLSKYSDCFSSGLKDLGFTTAGEMTIELENSEPVVYRPYRMSYSERAHVRGMVDEMLDAGIIKESSSPYASPIVLVKKKTGEKRLCVDYRALNRRTKKDHYPLPLIEDQLDQLSGHSLFTSLDLASGYYQIPIETSAQAKTAFVTPDGQYQFTRMPFGLVNAPSMFQRTINKVLQDVRNKYALIYMDDILIPAHTFEEGLSRLEEVLSLLKKGGLTLKLAKCNFFRDSVDFLGFQINADGIKPGVRKTEAISNFPVPKNQHEVRQFLGLASFFRRFVQGFALTAKPLTDLLQKNVKWHWETAQNESFMLIKSVLSQRPLLALYDPKKETQVHTDASKYGVAGILLQMADDGFFRPVSYYSRKTTIDEQKLHSFELETLAVVSSLSRFRVYLIGIPFKIMTDCNALRTTLIKRDLIPRIARWWVQIQEYDCEVEYRSGSSMRHVDALSRNPVGDAAEEPHLLDVLNVGTDDWISTVQSGDSEVMRIKQILCDPESEKVMDVIKNYRLKNGRVYRVIGEGDDDIRWVVPKGVRWQITKMNHDDLGHFAFEKTLARIKQSFWFPKMRKFVKKYVKSCLECAYHKGISGKQCGELNPIHKIEIPFHTIHADHLGPFVKSKKGNAYLLVIIDGFTKYINITPVRNTKTTTSINVIRDHISYFGAPSRLITDQGTSFTSGKFRAFMKSMGIKHILNAVATPRANGQVERFNRTILEALATKTHGKDDRSWDQHIPDIQIGLNTTVHKTTNKTASELLFGFRINNGTENMLCDVIDDSREMDREISLESLDQIRKDAGRRIVEQQTKDKIAFDSKRRQSNNYKIGDLISVRREVPSDGRSKKLTIKYQGPYRIVKSLGNDRFVVQDTPITRKPGRRQYENIVAIDKLKPWTAFNKDFDSSSESSSNSDEICE